jgi:septal ring factor EnvC (AmiA/AmiB activator)
MGNIIISEETVKKLLNNLLSEDTSKVNRQEYNRVQYKIEELQNSLSETIKEFRKLEDSIPEGLKTLSNGRVSTISTNLSNTHKILSQLKEKIKQHKKNSFSQQVDEKKK